MKTILTSLVIAIILCGFIYYNHQQKQPFRCDSQLVSHIEQDGSKVDLNLNANMIFTLHHESVVSFNGSVTQDGREYLVSRRIFFTTSPSELDGVKKTKITREQISKYDKLPAGIWQQYIFQGTEFYTQMTEVNNHGFLLQDLSNPLFICARLEN
ncbi:hypothetical protein [Serratia fonticola]|uniref:FidL-like membrane protein n=1 Tax=Serratia fonticola TaxID=47917 RepID=A0AAW3WLY4_SERFO|nr:hypothetical protein [Serratia fonticola]MBC3211571.1 hypothetical protein [Serratia fonticola]NYA12554.1 hypothetical protein [Serratia fonticola]NYA32133.1 hypothetical protein [Serratia fonticola]